MTTLRRSAAICGALLALPIAAIVAFRAHELRPETHEAKAIEPVPPPLAVIEQLAVREPPVKTTPPRRAAAAAMEVRVPARSPFERERDHAVGADENGGKSELAVSDPGGVERPARLGLKALSRATEEPSEEE